MEKLSVTDVKDLYVSRVPKNPIFVPQAAHQYLGTCFHVGFLRFNPPLSNYSRSPSTWDLQFSFTFIIIFLQDICKTLEGTIVFKTTDKLSPNINAGPSNANPNDRKTYLPSRMS
jgi:hypothetical protein